MQKKQIILVEEDETLVKSFQSILQSEGYLVEIAMTWNLALKKAKENKFDLAIIEIKLSDVQE